MELTVLNLKRSSKSFLVSIFLVLLQSCSQTPLGEELSKSFDAPIDQKTLENSASKELQTVSSIQVSQKIKKGPLSSQKLNKQKDKEISSSIISFQNQLKSEEQKTTFIPQPYRITIKLSAANPSAPAETVTKALRLAGVRFEVEMIELIEKKSTMKEMRSGRSKR